MTAADIASIGGLTAIGILAIFAGAAVLWLWRFVIASLRDQLVILQQNVTDLEERHVADIKRLHEKHDADIRKLTEKHDAAISEIEKRHSADMHLVKGRLTLVERDLKAGTKEREEINEELSRLQKIDRDWTSLDRRMEALESQLSRLRRADELRRREVRASFRQGQILEDGQSVEVRVSGEAAAAEPPTREKGGGDEPGAA